jgi:hypothetical protein
VTPRWDRRAALAAAALGLLLLLATLAFVIVDGGITQRTALLLFGGLALVAVYVVVDPAIVAALVRYPRSRPGSLGVVATAAAVGVLVGANVVASRSTQAAALPRSGLYPL